MYVNGRPDHQKGQHDDLIMAMAMAIYVGESSFTKLEKSTEQAKAMIESWTTDKTLFKDSSQNFNPNLSSINDIYHKNINYGITKSDYQNYSWLFSNKRI